MNLAILCSGGLGFEMLKLLTQKERPLMVGTDSKSDAIIELCKKEAIPCYIGNPRNGKLEQFIVKKGFQFDVILSINYLFIIELDVIGRAPYVINFHGSLLPKYRGRTPHVWSIINNEKKTGVTAHLIDEHCDTGPIVYQKEIPISKTDTGADVLKKYGDVYPEIIEVILEKIRKNSLSTTIQDESRATYFGKRSPSDGEINWNWSKERIYNWVRAQSSPYPGAFTFIEDKKITIDWIEFSDHGFYEDDANGKILSVSPEPIVKTPNGAVVLKRIRTKDHLEHIKQNKVFK